jgi:hypothetical protein
LSSTPFEPSLTHNLVGVTSSARNSPSRKIGKLNNATMPPIRNYKDHDWTDFEVYLPNSSISPLGAHH